MLDGGEAACHGPAQVTRVAQRPHRQAVQVNRLQQVGQERPLQAHNAPPVETHIEIKKKNKTKLSSHDSLKAFQL